MLAQDAIPQAGLSVDSKRRLHESAALDPAMLRRRRRRNLGGARELMYLYDGDHEGVCHHFGTDFGSKQWVNPVLTGKLQVSPGLFVWAAMSGRKLVTNEVLRHRVMSGARLLRGSLAVSLQSILCCVASIHTTAQCLCDPQRSVKSMVPCTNARCASGIFPLQLVTIGQARQVVISSRAGMADGLQVRASSPSCRHTDLRSLVDSRLARSNLASPCAMADGTRASWWCLDLGPHHRLACNYYTLRHDASNAFLRNWDLQVRPALHPQLAELCCANVIKCAALAWNQSICTACQDC